MTLRILVDEMELKPGLLGFSDIPRGAGLANGAGPKGQPHGGHRVGPHRGGLNEVFRLLAHLERKDSVTAFSKRADAVAWLVSTPTAT